MKIPEPRKLKSGNWFIQLRLNGVSIPVTAPTARECRNQAALIKAEHKAEARTVERGSSATLHDAIDKYITDRENTLSPLSVRDYRIIQKHRFQPEMQRRLKEIKAEEWQGIINREAALCAPKTLKSAWGFIRSVVKDATGDYPLEVRLPSVPPSEKQYLTPEQIRVFIQAVKETKYAVPALLALSSLRISEIEALRWENIPAKPEFIHVRGAVVLNEKNELVRKETNKNSSSTRNVPVLIPELAEALERDRRPEGPVMQTNQNNLRRGINRICAAKNLPAVGIHGLRHSFASLAYHLQIPERIAMEIGGWSDTATMHNIYTHISQSDISRYNTKLMDFFKNANENANDA